MQLNRVKIVDSPTGWLTLYGWVGKERIRWSLGTKKRGEAENRKDWIVRCVAEGVGSSMWPTLNDVLPGRTFELLSKLLGYASVTVAAKVVPTWSDIQASYIAALDAKILEGGFSESSKTNYLQSLREFDAFVTLHRFSKLSDINEDAVRDFHTWRKKSILAKRNSGKECKRLSFDLTVLRAVWNHTNSKAWAKAGFLPIENLWPKMSRDNKPGANPEENTQPFSGMELARMREAAAEGTYSDSQGRIYKLAHGTDLLAFELLLRTGLRRCDAATLTWKSVKDGMLRVKARKNKEAIVLPIHSALAAVLRAEKSRRNPSDSDTVLLNPLTGQAYDPNGKGLYRRMSAIGQRLGIEETRPHRFRCSFAVDALLKRAQPLEIARLLGDSLETVIKHYLPMSEALSKNTRDLLAREDLGLEAAEGASSVVSIGRKVRAA
jgi:integrase